MKKRLSGAAKITHGLNHPSLAAFSGELTSRNKEQQNYFWRLFNGKK